MLRVQDRAMVRSRNDNIWLHVSEIESTTWLKEIKSAFQIH